VERDQLKQTLRQRTLDVQEAHRRTVMNSATYSKEKQDLTERLERVQRELATQANELNTLRQHEANELTTSQQQHQAERVMYSETTVRRHLVQKANGALDRPKSDSTVAREVQSEFDLEVARDLDREINTIGGDVWGDTIAPVAQNIASPNTKVDIDEIQGNQLPSVTNPLHAPGMELVAYTSSYTSGGNGEWPCPRCTYTNKDTVGECELCSCKKPGVTPERALTPSANLPTAAAYTPPGEKSAFVSSGLSLWWLAWAVIATWTMAGMNQQSYLNSL
jgi:hypothetical protein